MLHLDFTDFSLIEHLTMPELTGCTRASISETAAIVLSDFCESTQCYREEIKLQSNGSVTQFDLISPHDESIIIGIFSVKIGSNELLPGDYDSHSPSTIQFIESPKEEITIVVILKTTVNAMAAPSSIVNRWADTISRGVRYRLMAQPQKPWSNPQMAGYYRQEYDADALRISGDIRNQFSVVRKGRAKRNQSFY
jgi:hypothetical protein